MEPPVKVVVASLRLGSPDEQEVLCVLLMGCRIEAAGESIKELADD
jgi:hypothetical protein